MPRTHGEDEKFRTRLRQSPQAIRWEPLYEVAALMKLGIAEHEAFTHGMSSKGPWVLSSSQAVHQALSTALLEERGLPSLLGIWTKLTAKSRIA
jgi:RNA-directed DNA polymerase